MIRLNLDLQNALFLAEFLPYIGEEEVILFN